MRGSSWRRKCHRGRFHLYEPRPADITGLDPALHHALVLVHPDFAPRYYTAEYLANLRSTVALAREAGLPVLYQRGHDCDCEDCRDPQDLAGEIAAAGGVVIPTATWSGRQVHARWHRRRYQKEVDAVCAIIGRSPRRTRLAFGGMFGDACVWAHASVWCRHMFTPPGDFDPREWFHLPRRPIARGDILSSICIMG